MPASAKTQFSLVIPVYKNEANIPDLLRALNTSILAESPADAEVVFVVDGSPDRSAELLRAHLDSQPWSSQLILHSRNFGSFAAIRTGLIAAKGEIIAVMTADLQEPSELIRQFRSILSQAEVEVVFGQRMARQDGALSNFLAETFWYLYRQLVLPDVPPGGLDVFGISRRVRDVVLSISEPNSSLVAQILWVGFKRTFIPYARQPRRVGKSAHGFRRKLTYMIDSVISFTDLPIMLLVWIGLVGLVVTGFAALVTATAWLMNLVPVQGYTPLMLMLAFGFSFLLLSQGILGLYLWRAFENTKRRPLSIVSDHVVFERITDCLPANNGTDEH